MPDPQRPSGRLRDRTPRASRGKSAPLGDRRARRWVDRPYFLDSYFRDVCHWSKRERAAMRFVGGRALDGGCGAGRVARHLQTKGHDVVAVDVSRLAVKVSSMRGVMDAQALTATQVDRRLGRFDTIVMMGNNLGLLANADRGRWLLRRWRHSTSEHVRVIGSTIDPYDTADPDHLAYHRRNRRRARLAGQARLRIRYRTLATSWFDYLFLSKAELETIAAASGWRVAHTLVDDGPGYVAVLEKAG